MKTKAGEVLEAYEYWYNVYREKLEAFKALQEPLSEYRSLYYAAYRTHALKGNLSALRALRKVMHEQGYGDIVEGL